MSTTLDTSHESMILATDEAAPYLAIPKATLYTWRTRIRKDTGYEWVTPTRSVRRWRP